MSTDPPMQPASFNTNFLTQVDKFSGPTTGRSSLQYIEEFEGVLELDCLPKDTWISVAKLYLAGPAKAWAQTTTATTWAEFKDQFLERFPPPLATLESFHTLRQRRGEAVAAFSDRFLAGVPKGLNLTEAFKAKLFCQKLTPEIKQQMTGAPPASLREARNRAKEAEQALSYLYEGESSAEEERRTRWQPRRASPPPRRSSPPPRRSSPPPRRADPPQPGRQPERRPDYPPRQDWRQDNRPRPAAAPAPAARDSARRTLSVEDIARHLEDLRLAVMSASGAPREQQGRAHFAVFQEGYDSASSSAELAAASPGAANYAGPYDADAYATKRSAEAATAGESAVHKRAKNPVAFDPEEIRRLRSATRERHPTPEYGEAGPSTTLPQPSRPAAAQAAPAALRPAAAAPARPPAGAPRTRSATSLEPGKYSITTQLYRTPANISMGQLLELSTPARQELNTILRQPPVATTPAAAGPPAQNHVAHLFHADRGQPGQPPRYLRPPKMTQVDCLFAGVPAVVVVDTGATHTMVSHTVRAPGARAL